MPKSLSVTKYLLHDDFGVSKDAAARAYAQFQGEPIAIAIVHGGKLLRAYRAPKAPLLCVNQGDLIPKPSSYWRARAGTNALTELTEVPAGHWLTSDWGKKLPNLYEQVLIQQGGYAMILLWPEFEEEDEDYDPDEDRTSKQRLSDRLSRSQR